MPVKNKPSKKQPAKQAVAKKAVKKVAKKAAKKATKSAPAKSTPAKKKPIKTAPANKKTPARAASKTALPEGVTRVEVSVLQITNVDPVNLTIQDVRDTPQVFYSTTQIDTEIDDVFDSTTTLTSVNWIVTNQAGYTVDVTFGTGSPITLNDDDSTTYPMTMPAAGACNSTNLFVQRDGQLKHDPVIKIKRKDGTGRVPNC